MSSTKLLPDIEYLRQALEYNPETGVLIWKKRPDYHFTDGKYSKEKIAKVWNGRYAGKEAGSTTRKYSQIKIDNEIYEAHRIAFYMTHGYISGEIDHINNNEHKCDNRINNLRVADRSKNQANRHIQKNNTSGYKGVSWHKLNKKWAAYIRVNNKRISLGYFDDPKIAYGAYCDAAKKHFGEYARLK